MSSFNLSGMSANFYELNNDKIMALLPNTVLLFLRLTIGVIGNGLVLFVYTFERQLKTEDRYFIPWLAVFDVIATIAGYSFGTITTLNPYNLRSDLVCKLLWALDNAAASSSALMLLAIAVQRYLKVCKPFETIMSLKIKRITVIIIAVVTALAFAPFLFFYREVEVFIKINNYNITGYNCGTKSNMDNNVFWGLAVTVFLLFIAVLTAIITLYSLILFKIYMQESIWRRKKPLQNQQENSCLNIKATEIDKTVEQSTSFTQNETEMNITVSSACNVSNALKGAGKDIAVKTTTKATAVTICGRIIQKHKFSIMFVLVAFIFVISFLPRFILLAVADFNPDFWDSLTNTEYAVYLFFYKMYLLNNIVNPLLYYKFDTAFWEACHNLHFGR